MALYVYKNVEEWALGSLRNAGYDVTHVYRVYQPKHPLDGNVTEVLYEEDGRAFTALIEPRGHVLVTNPGFG